MTAQNSTLADTTAHKIVKTCILITSVFILGACENRKENSEQVEMPQTANLPPENKHKYLDIAPELLASLKDPVCGMSVKNKVTDTFTYEHRLIGFCGTGCKEAFLQEPMQYKSAIDARSKK